ncbi:MAG: adenylate/guanylate cyclase domain-containing protein [Moorea sp. SIO2B7]|nr:adenylate/guanylate cyclase domain-containing protein [Moorena sp. SIO2B7]
MANTEAIRTMRNKSNQSGKKTVLVQPILRLLQGKADSFETNEYKKWRQNFMQQRLRLGMQIALLYFLTLMGEVLCYFFFIPEKFHLSWFLTMIVLELGLLFCLKLLQTKRSQVYINFFFLAFSWSITIVLQVIDTLQNVVNPDMILIWWMMIFFSQATLMPVCWYLHSISQLGAFAYYFGFNSAFGINFLPIYTPILSWFINIFWLFFISNISVYLYEKLAKAEFHSRTTSERLLLNILPKSIAQRLKGKENTIADSFTNVTVLFADLVGFTQLSATISPAEVVDLLNKIFSRFDQLVEKYGLEKIKTIGDAYLVVSGLPNPRDDHAEAMADMALNMQESLNQFNQQTDQSLRIRIGIHSGPVVAGVIGLKKIAYDLWGDTVNTASRMESHGIPDEIQVSEITYEFLRGKYQFEERGSIPIKGKGEMNTYLLRRKRKCDFFT